MSPRTPSRAIAILLAAGLLATAREVRGQAAPTTPIGPTAAATQGSLTPDLVPPAPRRPFEWFRRPEYHIRFTRGSCGIPWAEYDRALPRAVVSAASFHTVGPQPVQVPFELATPAAQSRAMAAALAARANPDVQPVLPASLVMQRKQFTLTVQDLTIPPLSLGRVGVAIYDDGRVSASGLMLRAGGLAFANVTGDFTVRVRAYSSPTPALDPLPSDAVLLWSAENRTWVPVGGPTEIPLIDPDRAFLIGPTVAATFSQVTHIEVAIEPRPIR